MLQFHEMGVYDEAQQEQITGRRPKKNSHKKLKILLEKVT